MGLAAIRPGDWDLPLLLHVGGAMLLVGSIVAVLGIALAARRDTGDAARLTRVAFRVLLLGVLPAWILMRIGAQWIASKEDWGDVGWLGLGSSAADGGLLLIVTATVVAWRAARRDGSGSTRAGTVVAALVS